MNSRSNQATEEILDLLKKKYNVFEYELDNPFFSSDDHRKESIALLKKAIERMFFYDDCENQF
jgi:hypothetical protein